jgi:hypothetical protein
MIPQHNLPRSTRRTVQQTLTGETGINDPIPRKKENQPETIPVAGDELRIYFQNVNGIKSGTREWEEMVTAMAKNKVGIFGFAETITTGTIRQQECVLTERRTQFEEKQVKEPTFHSKHQRAKNGSEEDTNQEAPVPVR